MNGDLPTLFIAEDTQHASPIHGNIHSSQSRPDLRKRPQTGTGSLNAANHADSAPLQPAQVEASHVDSPNIA
jgi:hypothetical protein